MNSAARTTASVALCTYNGAAYLPAQWQSLLDQQQLPDEVVICDDCSTDDTVALLNRLAAEAPFPVRVLVNEVRLGFNKNFERALSECTGDLIFICDQDDAWFPEKISTMTALLLANPQYDLAFCDAWVTDEHLRGCQNRFWEWIRFDKPTQARWRAGEMMDAMLDGNRVMGCATVIRRSFLSRILPIPEQLPGYIYDGWIGLVGAAYQTITFIDQPLQLYRTHPTQQVGVREAPPLKRVRFRDRFVRHRDLKLAPLRETQRQLSTISRLLAKHVPPDAPGLADLRRRLTHFTMRSHLPHDRLHRISPVLTAFRQGQYRRYADQSANWYAPLLAALGDLLE